ncbi:MauE/DoxX family redox-associated membrane protein [Spongiactinospora sp. 9N601]|uniref:MauE/DoxX family redox-associated membrane protein n=1 Tax=Spongiactinospora sp. 9N601 TaxID=3375149 RepID=UPI0037AF1A5C
MSYYIEISCALTVGLVFLAAALGKSSRKSSYRAFVESVKLIRFVPAGTVKLTATTTIVLEFAVGLLPILTFARSDGSAVIRAALFGLTLLLAGAFMVVILVSIRTKVSVPCRCFGGDADNLGIRHVVRNALLFLTAAAGATFAMVVPSYDVELPGVILAGGAGTISAVLLINYDAIVDLFALQSR